jgi:Zn-finger protein
VEGNKAIISSFYHTSLKEIKELGAVRTGIIISSLPVKPVELALWADADAIFPKRSNPNLFKKAHRHGIEVYPWTIDRDDEARWLIGIGADGIVTDNPSIMRKVADLPIKRTGRENCEYYPCHFEGQDCTHCFCPLYPCKDPTLGKFIRSSRKKRVWSCVECKLVHKPDVARYLSEHPDATTDELKSIDCGGTYASG